MSSAGTKTFTFKVTGQEGTIPQMGFGTACIKGQKCFDSVTKALEVGYRHIDTALLYNNQEQVGAAIKANAIPRDEIFVTSKVAFFPAGDSNVWMYNNELAGRPNFSGDINHKGDEARSITFALEQLQMKQVDLLLVHNPCVTPKEYNAACLPHFFELFDFQKVAAAVKPTHFPDGSCLRDLILSAKRKIAHDELEQAGAKQKALELRKSTWAAMEQAQRNGQAKYIGVSNYSAKLLEEMSQYATIMPAVNQLEFHPKFASPDLVTVAKKLGVVLTGYGQGHYVGIEKNEMIRAIAASHKKTSMQVVLRWMSQVGVVSVPRSTNPVHMEENLNIFDFELSDEEINEVTKLNQDHPFYWDPLASKASSE